MRVAPCSEQEKYMQVYKEVLTFLGVDDILLLTKGGCVHGNDISDENKAETD